MSLDVVALLDHLELEVRARGAVADVAAFGSGTSYNGGGGSMAGNLQQCLLAIRRCQALLQRYSVEVQRRQSLANNVAAGDGDDSRAPHRMRSSRRQQSTNSMSLAARLM